MITNFSEYKRHFKTSRAKLTKDNFNDVFNEGIEKIGLVILQIRFTESLLILAKKLNVNEGNLKAAKNKLKGLKDSVKPKGIFRKRVKHSSTSKKRKYAFSGIWESGKIIPKAIHNLSREK